MFISDEMFPTLTTKFLEHHTSVTWDVTIIFKKIAKEIWIFF